MFATSSANGLTSSILLYSVLTVIDTCFAASFAIFFEYLLRVGYFVDC